MKTQKQVRIAFKEFCPNYKTGQKHNQQTAEVTFAFSCFIDNLRSDNVITEKLASRVTLG